MANERFVSPPEVALGFRKRMLASIEEPEK
jgi:hypothetical protein